ncbi:MAG: DUF1232 domain-containing protein [Armatimonadota bacterium]|nr:DUF1232 domain-containing protein [Armatimonadota bacterium]
MRQDIPIGRPGLLDRMRFLYRLPRMMSLYWRLWRDERVPWFAKSMPILALLYVALPWDFVIDWLPALGQLDDAAIVILALRAFVRLSPAQVVEEHAADVGLKRI